MTTANDVGKYIFDKLGWIDAWRIQKLTYYVQAWSLAWDSDPIFVDNFEAWKDGPVSPRLHISTSSRHVGMMDTSVPGSYAENLTERQKAVIQAVLDFYGTKSRQELIELTHDETPWVEARGDLQPSDRCNNVISRETMQRTYTLQAISGQDVPKAPAPTDDLPAPVTDEIIEHQIERWSETLRWLATR